MKISILGTGVVGRAHASKLSSLGHEVVIATRDIEKTLKSNVADQMGNPPFIDWHDENKAIKLVTFEIAAEFGDIIFNALKGEVALQILTELKEKLAGKILVDISNPLDFSKGLPPSLFICNTDSLGEQIQKALIQTKVVKTFNTTTASLQVHPGQLADGDHDIYLCGNDQAAKNTIKEIQISYGWKNIIDLGDITTARSTEMLLPIWIRLWTKFNNPTFNFKIVK